MRIGIIGAGHAGVNAAETASALGADVVLFSDETFLPYYRPRLIAVACGQNTPEDIQMHPAEWYEEHNINLRLGCAVKAIDPATHTITLTDGGEESFDGIILANGAIPFRPPFMKDAPDCVIPLWNMEHALAIAAVVKPDAHILIVGGGILGIEAALRALSVGAKVQIVELMERLMAVQFGVKAAHVLESYLKEKGVGVATATAMDKVSGAEDGKAVAQLNNGETSTVDMVVISVGARRDLEVALSAGLDVKRGILVDSCMRTSADLIFACGDIVEIPGVSRCSALDATMQGRIAAQNIVATIQNTGDFKEYSPSSGAVNFKYEDFEVHSAGVAVDEAANEVILDVPSSGAFASLLKRDGVLVGVQMVGTGVDFRKYEKMIGQKA